MVQRKENLLQALMLLLISSLLAAGNSVQAQAKPNIIYILADDLGYGELSCYRQTKYTMPNIDRLAQAGMRFTQAYAGVSLCAPLRSTLMTGLHTGHTRIRNNFTVNNTRLTLRQEDVTVAEVLKQAATRRASSAEGAWAKRI